MILAEEEKKHSSSNQNFNERMQKTRTGDSKIQHCDFVWHSPHKSRTSSNTVLSIPTNLYQPKYGLCV